jgi:hypothetical protein
MYGNMLLTFIRAFVMHNSYLSFAFTNNG